MENFKMAKSLEKDTKKLVEKHLKSSSRQEKHAEKIGKHYKETEYATPKEARKGAMLQKRSIEEKERDVRRAKRFTEKHK